METEIDKVLRNNMFEALKEKGFFKIFKTYDEFRKRGEVKEKKRLEQIKKDEKFFPGLKKKIADIETLKKNYHPCSTEEYCKKHNIN